MAAGSKSNAPKPRKRVEAASSSAAPASASASTALVRNKDGSAFAKCEECNKDVPMALISFHSCSLDAKIKMNLEATTVERAPEVKKKPAERKKPTSMEPKAKRLRKLKEKDPNAPKRPPTAFFIFMEDFRKSLKEANSNVKAGKEVSKEGGEKWKSMSDEEKKPYFDKAAELKAEYEKTLASKNEEDENDNDEDNENENEGGPEEEDSEKKEEKEVAEKEEEEVLDDY